MPQTRNRSFCFGSNQTCSYPHANQQFSEPKYVSDWKGIYSTVRKLKGGGPQGGTFGILEYLSQSNDNDESVEPESRFKFVDHLLG